MNPRRIYNARDLRRLDKLDKITKEEANRILTEGFTDFTSAVYPEAITDRIETEDGFEYVVEGKIITMHLGEESYDMRFGERDAPPKRIGFDGERTKWPQVDKLYSIFLNHMKACRERYVGLLEDEKKKQKLVKGLEELGEGHSPQKHVVHLYA